MVNNKNQQLKHIPIGVYNFYLGKSWRIVNAKSVLLKSKSGEPINKNTKKHGTMEHILSWSSWKRHGQCDVNLCANKMGHDILSSESIPILSPQLILLRLFFLILRWLPVGHISPRSCWTGWLSHFSRPWHRESSHRCHPRTFGYPSSCSSRIGGSGQQNALCSQCLHRKQ